MHQTRQKRPAPCKSRAQNTWVSHRKDKKCREDYGIFAWLRCLSIHFRQILFDADQLDHAGKDVHRQL